MPALKVICPDSRAADVGKAIARHGSFEERSGFQRDGKAVTVFWAGYVKLARCGWIRDGFASDPAVTIHIGNGLPANVTLAPGAAEEPKKKRAAKPSEG